MLRALPLSGVKARVCVGVSVLVCVTVVERAAGVERGRR